MNKFKHKNILLINYLRKFLLIFFLLILFITTNAYSYSQTISNSLNNNILRLHIVANSNSPSDQIFKLKIRDKIIEYLNKNIDYKNSSKEVITNYLLSHMYDLYDICNSVAKKESKNNIYDTTFNINLTTSYFPTKQYSNILMPEGYYDCLKIEIGNSSGNNWWCSLYPPLCFTEMSAEINNNENLDNISSLKNSSLSTEEKDLLINSNTKKDIKFKFKLIELFNKTY